MILTFRMQMSHGVLQTSSIEIDAFNIIVFLSHSRSQSFQMSLHLLLLRTLVTFLL
jgi:hypothetical protein